MNKLGPKKQEANTTKKKDSLKQSFSPETGNIFGSSRLDVPKCYRDEADKKNYDLRWISAKQLKENHGSHKNHWAAYKFESKPSNGIMDSDRFAFGIDPEGVVRRGDCVLAVRPKELTVQHKEHLASKRNIYNRFSQSKKKEFKDYVKQESRGAMTVDDDTDE